MENLIDALVAADHRLWYWLHGTARADWLDTFIPFIRNQYFWAPLYLFLMLIALVNYRWRGFVWCLGFLLAFALADHVSASILKPLVGRVRPCNDPAMAQALHLLVPCGGGLSFPSSHASNHFAMATFTAITLGRGRRRWIWWPMMAWGTLVAYAQVYVGVHYPGDVLGGAVLGFLLGSFAAALYRRANARMQGQQMARPTQ